MRIIGNAGNSARKVQAVASGALASGDTVIVNSDGTVSVVAGSSASAGTAAQFESGGVQYCSSAFDSNSNKVVLSYADSGNASYGTAVVGTVSGTSISFGTPVVFESAEVSWNDITFDSSSNKIVTVYSDRGVIPTNTAIVGTVSGTSISFGSPATFGNQYGSRFSITFDSNSGKVVVTYNDGGNSDRGTAVVGTVSGTSISFGTPVVFETGAVTDIATTFDSTNNKVVVAYKDQGNSSYGTAVVGTVSGTSISFGTPVVYESATTDQTSVAYDSTNDKTVIAYRDFTNAGHGTAVVGTVSGTSISFGTPVVFETSDTTYIATTFDASSGKIVISFDPDPATGDTVVGTVSGTSISFDDPVSFNSGRSDWITSVYDSNSEKVVIAYADDATNAGEGVVFSSPSTNLTSENFIGIASNGYADTQAATINAKGFIDDNQTGLTAGQSYYVQTNGTLGTTAGSPSVFAGTAVSANKLIVKG